MIGDERPDFGCIGKLRHASQGAAKKHVAGLRGRGRCRGEMTHPYHCRTCRGWHIGRAS